MGDMITSRVSKSLPQIRVLQRTSDNSHTVRKSEVTLQKRYKIYNLTLRSQVRLSKFLTFINFLKIFSTSSDSKKFSMCGMLTPKVFKSLLQIRAVQRTSNYDRTIRRNETMLRNNQKIQNFTFQTQLRLSKFLTFLNFSETLRLQVALKNFPWVI